MLKKQKLYCTPTETYLKGGKVMIDEHRQTPDRDHQELHPEAVVIAVIGGPELGVDQVDGGVRAADVDHLERRSVELALVHAGTP